jgi:hypothetical protein
MTELPQQSARARPAVTTGAAPCDDGTIASLP